MGIYLKWVLGSGNLNSKPSTLNKHYTLCGLENLPYEQMLIRNEACRQSQLLGFRASGFRLWGLGFKFRVSGFRA